MLNNSPWLWNARKTAAGMTARTSLGIRILQGRRAAGQSNPSSEYLLAQSIAHAAWPLFRPLRAFMIRHFQILGPGLSAANLWYKQYADAAFLISSPNLSDATLAGIDTGRGIVSQTPFSTAPVADLSMGSVDWTMPITEADATQDPNDNLDVVIWNTTHNTYTFGTVTGRAAFGAISFPLPASSAVGNGIVVYTSTINTTLDPVYGGKSSDSVGANTLVVA